MTKVDGRTDSVSRRDDATQEEKVMACLVAASYRNKGEWEMIE